MPTLSSRFALSLIGMPGGGKSTVGRHLARRLNSVFVDTDTVIEGCIGGSIREFFEREGESRFRDIESRELGELIVGTPGVIATGGGIVLRSENRQLLRSDTVCIYLRSSPEELFRRLRHDTKRPLLQVLDPLSRLRELFAHRDPLYREAAHYVIETGRPSVSTLVHTILMRLELAGAIDFSTIQTPTNVPSVP